MVLLTGQIEGVSTRKDRTVAVKVGTNELDPTTAGQLVSLSNRFVHVLIKPDPITDVESMAMDEVTTDLKHIKSHSQRLRAVLFLNWQQNNKGYESFDGYYVNQMETMIEHFKGKLE